MCGRCLREGDTEEAWMKVVECAPVKRRRKPKATPTNEPISQVASAIVETPKHQWLVKNLIILKFFDDVSYLELMRYESSHIHFRTCDSTTEEYTNEVRAFLNSECIFTSTDSETSVNENRQEVLTLHLWTDHRSQVEELSSVMESLEASISSQLRLIFGSAYILPSVQSVQEEGSVLSIVKSAWQHLSSSLFSTSSQAETFPSQDIIDRLLIENELVNCNAKLLVLRPADIYPTVQNRNSNGRRKVSVTEAMSLIKRVLNTQNVDAGS